MICSCGCLECDIEWTNKGHNEICKKCGEKQFYPEDHTPSSKGYSFGWLPLESYPRLFANRHSPGRLSSMDS